MNHPFKDCRNSKKGTFKKQIRHCIIAVPNKQKLVNNPNPMRSRVIHSSTVVNSSTNWRLDYYKFRGYSYAQVLQNSAYNGRDKVKCSANKASTPVLPSMGIHPIIQVKNKPRVAQRVLVVKAEKSSPQVKVGLAEYKIPCSNRFSQLDRLHIVTELSSNVGTLLHDNYISPDVTSPVACHDNKNIKKYVEKPTSR